MIILMEDRHDGAFSGGHWLALRDECFLFDCVSAGPNGAEEEAKRFWEHDRHWIAAGNSPDAALAALGRRLEEIEL